MSEGGTYYIMTTKSEDVFITPSYSIKDGFYTILDGEDVRQIPVVDVISITENKMHEAVLI